MMKKRKLGIIGGSGLYKMEGFEKTKWKKVKTSWGSPSDEILIAQLGKEEICFIPRHARGHKINPLDSIAETLSNSIFFEISMILSIAKLNASGFFIRVVMSLNKIPFLG